MRASCHRQQRTQPRRGERQHAAVLAARPRPADDASGVLGRSTRLSRGRALAGSDRGHRGPSESGIALLTDRESKRDQLQNVIVGHCMYCP